MTFYSLFVNLRKKCAIDCCTITNLNGINHILDSLVDSLVFLALKDVDSSPVALKYFIFSYIFFDLLVCLFVFIFDFVHNWIHLFEFHMRL